MPFHGLASEAEQGAASPEVFSRKEVMIAYQWKFIGLQQAHKYLSNWYQFGPERIPNVLKANDAALKYIQKHELDTIPVGTTEDLNIPEAPMGFDPAAPDLGLPPLLGGEAWTAPIAETPITGGSNIDQPSEIPEVGGNQMPTGTDALIEKGYAASSSTTRMSWMPSNWVIIGTVSRLGGAPGQPVIQQNVWGEPGGPEDISNMTMDIPGFQPTDSRLQERLALEVDQVEPRHDLPRITDPPTPDELQASLDRGEISPEALYEGLIDYYTREGVAKPEEAATTWIDSRGQGEQPAVTPTTIIDDGDIGDELPILGEDDGWIDYFGETPGEPGEPYGRTAAEMRAEQEEANPSGVFERFLMGTTEGKGLATASPFVRQAQLRQAPDVFSQYQILGDTDPGFESFLETGRPTSAQLSSGLGRLQQLLNADPTGIADENLLRRRGIFDVGTGFDVASRNLRRALLQPTLAEISPAFRGGFVNTANDIFSRLMAKNPERRLINQAAELGFFGEGFGQ